MRVRAKGLKLSLPAGSAILEPSTRSATVPCQGLRDIISSFVELQPAAAAGLVGQIDYPAAAITTDGLAAMPGALGDFI